MRQVRLEGGIGADFAWEPSDGFGSLTDCRKKAAEMLAANSKGPFAERQAPNGIMMGGDFPIGDNTVTITIGQTGGNAKTTAYVISFACFPPTFNPRRPN